MKHSRQDRFELHACAACPLLIRVYPCEFVVPQKTYKSCPAIPDAIFDPIVPRFFAGREALVSYPYWRYRENGIFSKSIFQQRISNQFCRDQRHTRLQKNTFNQAVSIDTFPFNLREIHALNLPPRLIAPFAKPPWYRV